MGILGLYPWLVERYPNTVCSVSQKPYVSGRLSDLTDPNPNGVEFDNLYIDMNGIIHPCFHPSELGTIPEPKSYHEVIMAVLSYIDKVFSIVRPRKLLFLAVDGVAPRAKMNHQRIRRYRTAKEAADSAAKLSPLHLEADTKMDPNVITPGTDFMELLSLTLKHYVDSKITKAPAWQDIKVILSDSSVVGEGEYKIMSYIRSQRNLPEYDPNTRHCLHGMDADLIMLALATHEIHISILREVITYGKRKKVFRRPNQMRKPLYLEIMKQCITEQKFEFFNIWVLREYLERDLPNVPGIDFERLIDDFVFFCFFVGNDFLPRLPLLDTSKGGIEMLLIVYQEEFVKMGYLTNAPEVNLKTMEHFLQALSSHENVTFFNRGQLIMEKSRSKRKRRGFQDSHDQASIVELQSISRPSMSKVKINKNQTNRMHYIKKFDCKHHDIDIIKRDAVLKYTEGVCWVMHYYYQELCSWQWFYPYHYAPFASDFCGLDKLEINFILGQPLKPLVQLLAVLPASRELMTMESSPILDFYTQDAKVDRNGKKKAWQGVWKLPFIDESRLLSETVKVESTLTDKEKQRNRFGMDKLFVNCQHPLSKFLKEHLLCYPGSKLQIQITPILSGGVTGYVSISDNLVYPCKLPFKLESKYNKTISVSYTFPSFTHIPKLLCGVIMPPKILRCQVTPRPPVLCHADVSQYIHFESPSEKIQKKKRKQDDKGQKLEEVSDHCVDGKKDDTQNIINGCKSEVDLVEGRPTEQIEQKDKQVKSDTDEKTSSRGDHGSVVSLDGEPKRKQGKKKKRRISEVDLVKGTDQLEGKDIIDHLVTIPSAAAAEEEEANNNVEVGEELRTMVEYDLVKGQEINISCEEKLESRVPVVDEKLKKKKKKAKEASEKPESRVPVVDEKLKKKKKKAKEAGEKPESRVPVVDEKKKAAKEASEKPESRVPVVDEKLKKKKKKAKEAGEKPESRVPVVDEKLKKKKKKAKEASEKPERRVPVVDEKLTQEEEVPVAAD